MKKMTLAAAFLTVVAPSVLVSATIGTASAGAAPAAHAVGASTSRTTHHGDKAAAKALAKKLVRQQHTCTTTPAAGHASCSAVKLVDSSGASPKSSVPPSTGLTAAGLESAYKLTGLKSGGRTVAIVDAYGYPNLARDLAVYRSQFGLPACTVASGCLTIENQSGSTTSLPKTNVGWDGEQALDVDAVSAACPDCKILMVQATSTSFASLGAAVNTAAKHAGVAAISNSYGGSDAPDSSYGSYYNHPGIAVTASSGDDGYQGASFPASSAYVTGVGGTSLVSASTTRGWSETVWSGAGSGCSTDNVALTAASSSNTGCAGRAMSDVSAAADPNNGGMAVYYPTSATASTWGQVGGTSEASPIIASVYALSGNTSGYANAIPYAHKTSFFDVTSGNNGTCPTTQWCTARAGWDGPTGLGTPNGVSGF